MFPTPDARHSRAPSGPRGRLKSDADTLAPPATCHTHTRAAPRSPPPTCTAQGAMSAYTLTRGGDAQHATGRQTVRGRRDHRPRPPAAAADGPDAPELSDVWPHSAHSPAWLAHQSCAPLRHPRATPGASPL